MRSARKLCGRAAALLSLALTVLPTSSPALASGPGRQELIEGDPALAKVSSHLLRARQLTARGETPLQIAATEPLARLKDGRAEVEIRLESGDLALIEAITAAGLELSSAHPQYGLLYGRVALDELANLAAIPGIATISPMPHRGTRAGSVANQADVTMNADDARSAYGVSGTGVTVGVLSDSFNAGRGGTVSGGSCTCAAPGSTCATVVNGMTNQASGDLPGSIPIIDDCTIGSPNCDVLSDEGAAIGELIFDIAPGASFQFHSAFNSPGDFAGGITELANCGSHVIVDDVFWTGQPFFQDGAIAQAAQGAVDMGVPYFSAAGNDATFGVHDAYVDSNPVTDNFTSPANGADLHDFGGGDRFASITIPNNCDLFAELQWSEPFSGTLGAGASSDLDLYLLSSAADPASTGGANVLTSSTSMQGCGVSPPYSSGTPFGNPSEQIFYMNTTGASDTVFLAVEHFCGTESLDLRIVTISFSCPTTSGSGFAFESHFMDAQIFGHPAAKGVAAVGAAFYGEIDSGGSLDPPGGQLDVEPFSSLGGNLPFFFDADGDPLPGAPQVRAKPEITAPDGTNTTFFGSVIGFDGDLNPNFFGTSAAAPHAAAVAALMRELAPGLGPKALLQVLEQTALDMESPGFDFLSGAGEIDAHRSLNPLQTGMASIIDDLEFDLDGDAFTTPGFSGMTPIQANDSILFADGDFTGVDATADSLIFADGFESGDTSAWSN